MPIEIDINCLIRGGYPVLHQPFDRDDYLESSKAERADHGFENAQLGQILGLSNGYEVEENTKNFVLGRVQNRPPAACFPV